MNQKLFENLSSKIGKNLEVRRYNLSDMISESYRVFYACDRGTTLQKMAEAHINDVRQNPSEIERLSEQLCLLKEAVRLKGIGKLRESDLVAKKSYDTIKPRKERVIVQDRVSECDDTAPKSKNSKRLNGSIDEENISVKDVKGSIKDLEESDDIELTDEEVEELAKHLEEIRNGKKSITEEKEEGCQSKDIEESKEDTAPARKGIKCSRFKGGRKGINESSDEGERVFQLSLDFLAPTDFDIEEVVDMISNDLSQAGYEVLGHSQDTSWSKEEYGLSESKRVTEGEYHYDEGNEKDQMLFDAISNILGDCGLFSENPEGYTKNEEEAIEKLISLVKSGGIGYFNPKMRESKRVRGKRLKAPKYWDTLFATKVIDAYNKKELSKENIDQWETKYNDGIKPQPSLGTKEILDYYIETGKDPRQNESKSYRGLETFSKNSTNKAFYKTFKKMHESLKEGKALTRQESMNLYKAANSAMTQLSVELEHNPEFLKTFNECTTILAKDVDSLLESMKNGKAPSKKTMKSLAKFSGALLNESAENVYDDDRYDNWQLGHRDKIADFSGKEYDDVPFEKKTYSDEEKKSIYDKWCKMQGDRKPEYGYQAYTDDTYAAWESLLDESKKVNEGHSEDWYLDRALDYMYGEDRDMDNSVYSKEEKDKALAYYFKKKDSCIPYDESKKVEEARDLDKVKKRIARTNEFDNGKVLYNWKQMTSEEAEELAKQKSLEDPDSTYYVAYDDIMNPGSEYKWKNGKKVNESAGDEAPYKLRIYKKDNRRGDLDHEETFNDRESMVNRYEELFKYEDYSLNPTAWTKTESGWRRIVGFPSDDEYVNESDEGVEYVIKSSRGEFLSVGSKSWVSKDSDKIKKFTSEKEASDYMKKYSNDGGSKVVKVYNLPLIETTNGSVEDFLSKMSNAKDKSEVEKVYRDAKGNPNAEAAYKKWKELNEADDPEEELDDIPEEDTELSPEVEDFDQEYADGRQELHNKLADKFGDSEDPEVQDRLEQDRVDVAIINGEDPTPEESEDDEEIDDIEPEEEVEESEDITDDELAELKKHLKEMRDAKNK